MKTIEEGLNEAYQQASENAYFGNGFKAGVEFAQQWINISDELPCCDIVILKTTYNQMYKIINFSGANTTKRI